MSETPERDREAIHRRARQMAIRMGYRQPDPDPADVPEVTLPTDNLFVLRGLLVTNRLTREQAELARRKLAEGYRAAYEAESNPTPPTPSFPGGAA